MVEEVKNETVDENTELATVDDEEDYREDRAEVIELREQVENRYWVFGEKLSDVYSKYMYLKWGYETWKEYVAKELDFDLRKAQYLVKIQGWLKKMPVNVQEFMHDLGWTKTRMLMHVITVDNFDMWKNRVEGKTVAEIEDILKSDVDDSDDDAAGGGGGDGSDVTGKETEQRETFKFVAVGNQIPTYHGAIERAMELAETDNKNQAVAMIFAEFMSNNTTSMTTVDYLASLEKALGLTLIAMRLKKDGPDEVVFGHDYINSVEETPDAE